MFTRVLVANRGEIALRVIRSLKELGVESVAVASDADLSAPHALAADHVVPIGPAPATESYLRIEALIQAARDTGCQAVHPGYGFLSENAAFAQACADAGLVFIGPSPEAMRLMGSKTASRDAMIAAGVPVVPGYQGQGDDAALAKAAAELGWPVVIKASAGGGGKGMRVVRQGSELLSAIALARSEAQSAFGNDLVYVEKYLERPRHIEVQIFGDADGNVFHLGERECSVQRRHQKILEECPSPVVTPDLRARMGEAAVAAARAVDYRNAGTVEFLLAENGDFYFLEMNTRLQVEHPVTELVYGVDLVAMQLRTAAGEPLGFDPTTLAPRGHAIEARLYAEDPDAGFLPQTGRVLMWRTSERPGVRLDSGLATGLEIGIHYDPLLAKIIAWGPTREAATQRLHAALRETVLLGVTTNLDFLADVLALPAWGSGALHTAFLEEHADALTARTTTPDAAAALAAWAATQTAGVAAGGARRGVPSPWTTLGAWRPGQEV